MGRRWELEEVSRRSKLVAQQHHAWIGRWQARMTLSEQPSLEADTLNDTHSALRSARSTGVHVSRSQTPSYQQP